MAINQSQATIIKDSSYSQLIEEKLIKITWTKIRCLIKYWIQSVIKDLIKSTIKDIIKGTIKDIIKDLIKNTISDLIKSTVKRLVKEINRRIISISAIKCVTKILVIFKIKSIPQVTAKIKMVVAIRLSHKRSLLELFDTNPLSKLSMVRPCNQPTVIP